MLVRASFYLDTQQYCSREKSHNNIPIADRSHRSIIEPYQEMIFPDENQCLVPMVPTYNGYEISRDLIFNSVNFLMFPFSH